MPHFPKWRHLAKSSSDFFKRGKKPHESKIFCVGFNKTGTTSLAKALAREGILVGNQRQAEKLLPHYLARDFDPIVDYCQSARAFQDFPFSAPETFVHLDRAFPQAKFILTIRNSSRTWLRSHLNFIRHRLGENADLETLKQSDYVWKSWSYDVHQDIFGRGVQIDDHEAKIRAYETHNAQVQAHFAFRPDQLLVIDLAQKDAFKAFQDFLQLTTKHQAFPWENATNQ